MESRVALTLRMAGGLTVAEIARTFLVQETTMGQRITRAKAKIRVARIPVRQKSLLGSRAVASFDRAGRPSLQPDSEFALYCGRSSAASPSGALVLDKPRLHGKPRGDNTQLLNNVPGHHS